MLRANIMGKVGNLNFWDKDNKKFGHFDSLSGKYHVKFGLFVNFSYTIFGQKCPVPTVN